MIEIKANNGNGLIKVSGDFDTIALEYPELYMVALLSSKERIEKEVKGD